VDFNCVQRYQGFVTAVGIGCGPMVNLRIKRRLVSSPREQQPRTSHLRVNANSCITE
jgi:hypothetical protein